MRVLSVAEYYPCARDPQRHFTWPRCGQETVQAYRDVLALI